MREVTVSIIGASYHGNKGAAAMLQSSIKQLRARYGAGLNVKIMSVYPSREMDFVEDDFVSAVPCTPERLLFWAFPLALLYRLLRWCPPIAKLLRKEKIIAAYAESDLVLDEFGVAFVDSRGTVMNIYSFVALAVPMLVGAPVIKYSQALGTFKSGLNRFLARWILPKVKCICARGEITKRYLAEIGIEDNVTLCADGAFSMPDDAVVAAGVAAMAAEDDFYASANIAALSLSSVVEGKCTENGIDYPAVMARYVDWLAAEGYPVLLIANAARTDSDRPRNNDLMVCDAVYEAVKDKTMVRWYREEMTPEKIRELIGRCRFLVASRFHAMIAGLEREVPTILVGWSHKYEEVMDMFGLGRYAVNYAELNLGVLKEQTYHLLENETDIRAALHQHLPAVKRSSARNIEVAADFLDETQPAKKPAKLLDMAEPERYLGPWRGCRKGYAADEDIRENSASGGMVTALLCSLLAAGEIDGAWVTRCVVEGGKLTHSTHVATTAQEIRAASGSIYLDLPLLKELDTLRNFEGRVATVLLPCQNKALAKILEKDAALAEKIALRLSLYCSGCHSDDAVRIPLQKNGVDLSQAAAFRFRRGHWRGETIVDYKDGHEQRVDYTKNIGCFRNAYFFLRERCVTCQDHFGRTADLAMGDLWLKEMKKQPIKHTSCVLHTEQGERLYKLVVARGDILEGQISAKKTVMAQKRALVFKFHCAGAKADFYAKQGRAVSLDTQSRCRWNHRLAFFFTRRSRWVGQNHPGWLEKTPQPLLFLYMLFLRFLLNF